MKTICYISNFSPHLDKSGINDLINFVNSNNRNKNITGILILRNGHFFQILEGKDKKIDRLFHKIQKDKRHHGIIKLLDTEIDYPIFIGYNSGEFEVFQKFTDMKKLYLYFNWIKNASYLPADRLIQLTTNFLNKS